MGHLRGVSPGPHVPAAARIQPARRRRVESGEPDRSARRRLGHRGVRQPLPVARPPARRDAPRADRADARRRAANARWWCSRRTAKSSLGALAARPHRAAAARSGATAPSASARRDEIEYVLPFENRGAEVGVTLHHPHGQIYAYPVVPPVPARMQQVAAEHHRGSMGAAAAGR